MIIKQIKYLFLFLLPLLLGATTTHAKTELVLPQNQVIFSVEQSQSFYSLKKEVQPNIGFLKEKTKFVAVEGVSAVNTFAFSERVGEVLANAGGKLFNDVDIVALNKIIPSGANKSYLGKTIINTPNNSIKSIPSTNSPLLQKVDNYIAQTNSNLKGQIGEEIAEELVKDMDGFVHYPCKLNGSDNGFDVVAIKGNPSNPIEIRIIESKPMNSGSVNLSVTVNKGTQMDDFWIDKTIEAMRNSSDQNLIDIGNNLFYNRDKITKLISTIDKTSKEVILIKLDAF